MDVISRPVVSRRQRRQADLSHGETYTFIIVDVNPFLLVHIWRNEIVSRSLFLKLLLERLQDWCYQVWSLVVGLVAVARWRIELGSHFERLI